MFEEKQEKVMDLSGRSGWVIPSYPQWLYSVLLQVCCDHHHLSVYLQEKEKRS